MKITSLNNEDYVSCVTDLIAHEKVWSMDKFIQHANVSCLEHSFNVSYVSYLICKRFKLDYSSAARGGLLHDFFLYNWHGTGIKNLHSFKHPGIALKNADKYFELNNIEKDIIKKHMWPLTVVPPMHVEAYIVMLVDKYCAIMEVLRISK